MRYVFCAAALVCGGACGGAGAGGGTAATSPYAPAPPEQYGYRVVGTFEHDPGAFTQGLLWHDGALYESTGIEGRSTIRRTELAGGRVVESRKLSPELFGEGLAMVGGKFYQLTWLDGRALVWDMELSPAGEFAYRGEGWGLCTDGERLYMSDGSDCIRVVDPANFRTLRTFQVVTDKASVPMLNELEWIDGQIWANVYMTDRIVRIDPLTGHVKGVVDLTGIYAPRGKTGEEVLNGIAHDGERIFVTGKNWSKLFEIEVTRR